MGVSRVGVWVVLAVSIVLSIASLPSSEAVGTCSCLPGGGYCGAMHDVCVFNVNQDNCEAGEFAKCDCQQVEAIECTVWEEPPFYWEASSSCTCVPYGSCSEFGGPCSSNSDCCSGQELVCHTSGTCAEPSANAWINEPDDGAGQSDDFSVEMEFYVGGGIADCQWRIRENGNTQFNWASLGCNTNNENEIKTRTVTAGHPAETCDAGTNCEVCVRAQDDLGTWSNDYCHTYPIDPAPLGCPAGEQDWV